MNSVKLNALAFRHFDLTSAIVVLSKGRMGLREFLFSRAYRLAFALSKRFKLLARHSHEPATAGSDYL